MEKRYEVTISNFNVNNVAINNMNEVQEYGRSIIHKYVPGILDIFPNILFSYQPMSKRLIIEQHKKRCKEYCGEYEYNRLVLLNGHHIRTAAINDRFKSISRLSDDVTILVDIYVRD